MSEAGVAIVLSAHVPFVRHLEREDAPEEAWLFATVTETLVPLFEVLAALGRDRVPARLSLAASPPLLAMLGDRVLRGRYLTYLDHLVERAESEERRTRRLPTRHDLAATYLARALRARSLFLDEWQQDVPAALRAAQDAGQLEILAGAATSAILPLLATSPGAVRAQVEVGVGEYRRVLGRAPRGFWLPECAYAPGLDEELARADLRWTVVESHGVAHATPRPVHGVYAPVACASGVAVFARDPEALRSLTHPREAFVHHPAYREPARGSGFAYHANAPDRGPYDPLRARAQAEADAAEFVDARRRQAAWLAPRMGRPPVMVCAIEADVLGRWWFEGPHWLEHVLRHLARTPGIAAVTPADDLARHPVVQEVTPAASSWRADGYYALWLSAENDWVYRHLHVAAERLHGLCRRHPTADERRRRALTQALRELLLAQSGDWPLLMTREDAARYAVRRLTEHLRRCEELCAAVEAGAVDDLRLAALEDEDNIFAALDYRVVL
jgi:1,4-alpha-glucan branching enzyme